MLIFALPAGGGIAWYAINARDIARQEAYKKVEIIVGDVSKNLGLMLRDYERLLKAVASEYQGNPPVVAKNFNPGQLLHTDPLVIRLGVRDLQANLIDASLTDALPAEEALKFSWVQQGVQSETFAVSGAVQEPLSGRWAVMLTYPVRDAQGTRTGFVNLSLDLLSLNERLLASIPSNVVVPVLDRTDQYLLRSADALDMIGKTLPQNIADALRWKVKGFATSSDLQGVTRLYAVASIPSAGWRVFAGMTEVDVLAPAQKTFRYIVTVGMTMLLMLVALAWMMANAIARPVRDLAETARKIAIGQEGARAPVAGPAEVAEVAREFNQMLDTRKLAEQKLVEREFLLRESQRVGRIGSYALDLATNQWISSEVLDQIFGLELQDQRSKASWSALVHPEDRAGMLHYLLHDVVEMRKPFDREYRVVRPIDGDTRWVWGLGELSFNELDQPVKMIGTVQDITERKKAEVRQQLAASVFTHAREGITITDPSGTIIDVNDMFTQITGYSRKEALGQNPRFLQSGRHDKAFYVAMWHDLTTQGHWSAEIWNRRKSGEVYAEILTISAVRDDQGNTLHYVALFSDITAIKAHQKQLEHMAHYDTLTGLPNRLLLSDRLRQAIAQGQRRDKALAVVYLDLDNIKAVNDTHGHEAGDAVLMALSEAMQNALREGDTLARLGGDEFVAVLVDLDTNLDCIPVIERLLAAASTVVELPASTVVEGDKSAQSGQSIQVTASIGVTFYPQDNVDAEVMLRHADQAMYLAKQGGKNRYHLFDIARDAAVQTRHDAVQRISDALAQGEFVLYYQPKVNMRTGEVIGAEALIRWQHPERGLVPPGDFLPTIEDHPISIALGEWVIDTAMTQLSTWQAQGLDLVVSVNIGALQMQQDDFPERLRAILAAHADVPPHCLQLEILETSALQDIAKVSAVMHACRAMEVSFALDDFGTGYSSLTYLKHLPAEVLKIDQSFIRNMTDNPDDLAIVRGVIGLAEVFHRQVIAEGVETRTHGDLLLSIGCDLAQGYGVARPMPADALPAWALQWREGGGLLASSPS
ncbi:bifunctional diguanylate cyclase/phosphodiesterase [Rhodoferax antarcticus]|uniref:bifunctional diguanylate cyclase/phosphodiesterase n=1 Tax=Rhodoferax antarcticus TaxID=81479 RepID=UPI002223FEFE|nr:EAL domain-containing protein [Rhodoferax antarcticus]MCW2311813.1 diguanylate cyclase (GGDEF)-like protein/PAS domain S-box-containing protein [Rhodoferax antarcticus]